MPATWPPGSSHQAVQCHGKVVALESLAECSPSPSPPPWMKLLMKLTVSVPLSLMGPEPVCGHCWLTLFSSADHKEMASCWGQRDP